MIKVRQGEGGNGGDQQRDKGDEESATQLCEVGTKTHRPVAAVTVDPAWLDESRHD